VSRKNRCRATTTEHDPEKWKPVSRLREAIASTVDSRFSASAGEGRSEKIMLNQTLAPALGPAHHRRWSLPSPPWQIVFAIRNNFPIGTRHAPTFDRRKVQDFPSAASIRLLRHS
jgi:hypothetical protein